VTSDTDHYGSNITGQHVFSSAAADAQDFGAIKDIVVDKTGTVRAIIIGVGGFLGIGEKNVAVDYNQLQWTRATDGSLRAVLNTTKDALNAAPDFKFTDALTVKNGGAANAAQTAPATNTPPPTSPAGDQGVDLSTLKPVDTASLKSDDLKGIDVIDPAGRKLAEIDDFVLTSAGKVDAVLVNFGGFLGIGKKEVAIGFEDLKFLTDPNNKRYLEVNVTKEQLDAQPAYNKDDYMANRAAERLVLSSSALATSSSPESFVMKAGPANAFEIASSQLALTKAQNADIKTFAQRMITDHTKAGDDLKAAAGAQKIAVPAEPDATETAEINKLNSLSGNAFDKEYVAAQTNAHADAVNLFKAYVAGGQNGAVKDFAAAALPTLQMHYEMVQKLPQ